MGAPETERRDVSDRYFNVTVPDRYRWLENASDAGVSAWSGGRLFAFFNQPPKQQPMIAVMGPEIDPAHARIVLDPNALNPSGTTAID